MWETLNGKSFAHYSVMSLIDRNNGGMEAIRALFPEGQADELNFILFSTSGVHGTYNNIEDAEHYLNGDKDEDGDEYCQGVTFLIVHPRLVALRYGVCEPQNKYDIEYLKKLRESSHEIIRKIGTVG